MAIIWVGAGRFNAYIGPVQDYIDRVVAADVAAGNTLGLEVGVRDAYDVFIRDSINVGDLGTSGGVLSQANSIIKASCILAGARTLAGALVPLVGAAPTNFYFMAGDYDRETGLKGDGSTKHLNSNRNNNADPQDSRHAALYASDVGVKAKGFLATDLVAAGGRTELIYGSNDLFFHRCNSSVGTSTGVSVIPGFYGLSRSQSSSYTARSEGADTTVNVLSDVPASDKLLVFRRGTQEVSSARIAFYSIGEALDLALLDARVTTLINAIAAAIP